MQSAVVGHGADMPGASLLHRNVEILKILATIGGLDSLFATDDDGRTCLHKISKFGHSELLHCLLKEAATSSSGRT